MIFSSPILVTGSETMEGLSLLKTLQENGFKNLFTLDGDELRNPTHVARFFEKSKLEYVFLLGGKSGGIKANQEMPATLMIDNLQITSNILSAAHKYGVKKLLFLASSCVYPKYCEQPMKVDMLMTGSLEPTNTSYAMAKLAGIELCSAYRREYKDNFISAIPANLFGPEDDFSTENSHVISALIAKIHQASKDNLDTVEIWGTGSPKREFIYVDDFSSAAMFLMQNYEKGIPINIGSNEVISISKVAEIIKQTVQYQGKLIYNTKKPDGMPIKTLDSSVLTSLGWKSSFNFQSAIELTYKWFLSRET